MSEQSSVHAYLNWAKQRIDEMDAALASLETKASQLADESKVKSDQLIAELKKRRDEFQITVKKQAENSEAAWERTKPQLESQWNAYQAQLKTYFETAGKQLDQQQATFKSTAAAQAKAWREAADNFQKEAAKVAVAKRSEIEESIKKMKVDAADAQARLHKLGSESWTAFSAALAESRKAFDKANNEVANALKRAAPAQR